ncbi:MAG: oxidoreductase [Candidatus Hodarchaeales archaeon]|jgi:hypothetical protein
MVALPTQDLTIAAIYKSYEDREAAQKRRTYLGGSQIGEECRRMLWYSFRWVRRPAFPGRILRLFDTGHREEERIIADLRAVGCEVLDKDPNTDEQWEYVACEGHLMTHLDGVVLGLLESPKTWHLLECKTSNAKGFTQITKHGCAKAKPVHVAQIQLMMGLAGLKRAAYYVQNKDTDDLHQERIKYDSKAYKALIAKANAIIKAESPPERIGKDPSFFKCKFCDYSDFCFGKEFPDVNCRTCVHSSPVKDGKWACAREFVTTNEGCTEHIFLPSMIEHWAEPIGGDPTWIKYRADGYEFVNCAATGFPAEAVDHYSSKDLRIGREPYNFDYGPPPDWDDDDIPF